MEKLTSGFIAAVMALSAGGAFAKGPADPDWTDVGALFQEKCVMCHSGLGAGKGLRLDSYEAALAGSSRGAVLVAGDPEGSELIRRLKGASLPRMPFLSYPLPDEQIEMIAVWIANGLPRTSGE